MRATGLRAGGLAGRSGAESGLDPSLPTPSALGSRVHRSPVDVCGGIGTLTRTVAFPDLASPDLSLEELSLSQTFWAQSHPHPHLKNVSRAKKEGGRWKRLSLAAFHATSSPVRPPVQLAKLWPWMRAPRTWPAFASEARSMGKHLDTPRVPTGVEKKHLYLRR